ncbi:MAG: hypothetical protein CMN27_02220 [Salinisphaera sp.]|nr:hypothetical protein [Salinisphaera sp.]
MVISDQGPGVPEQERSAIFDAFYQGTNSKTHARGALRGTGIGLSVVRECVQAHGGRIDVTDAPGGGAQFTVEIPDRHAV